MNSPSVRRHSRPALAALCALLTTSAAAQASDSAPAPATEDTAATAAPIDPTSSPGRPIRVAVYDLQLQDVPERVGRAVSNNLVAELRKLERVAAVAMSEVRDMLTHEQNKQLLGCSEDSCLAEIAGALGVDELITGTLSTVAGSSVINLRRIDLVRALVVGSVDQRLTPDGGAEFLAAIGPAVDKLYPAHPLKPGHRRGVAAEVALRLNPPPLPTWAFWATAGGALGLGLLGGGAAVMAAVKYDEAQRYAAQGVPPNPPIDNTVLLQKEAEFKGWDVAALCMFGTAGALALAAGLQALFTDWHGYGDEEL